ncbi:hypothetical protein [Roseateles sp.]|uniref:hypothetical protein n=1 Tax=Roseateles sp. TaxID=1971397 RepID=UPI0031E33FE9
MLLVAIAWMYVVLMMALAEAFSTQGSVLGALMTFVLYGVVPLAIVMYLMGTPMRRKARRRAEALEAETAAEAASTSAPASAPISAQPDDGGHAAAAQSVDALVTERKEA